MIPFKKRNKLDPSNILPRKKESITSYLLYHLFYTIFFTTFSRNIFFQRTNEFQEFII